MSFKNRLLCVIYYDWPNSERNNPFARILKRSFLYQTAMASILGPLGNWVRLFSVLPLSDGQFWSMMPKSQIWSLLIQLQMGLKLFSVHYHTHDSLFLVNRPYIWLVCVFARFTRQLELRFWNELFCVCVVCGECSKQVYCLLYTSDAADE